MEPAAPDTTTPAREIVSAAGQRAHASPSIRKLARELGVGLEQVSGSGPKGRITHDDMHKFVRSVLDGSSETIKAPPAGASGFCRNKAVRYDVRNNMND